MTTHHTGLSLRHNFSWSFVGNIVYAASQWAALSALTKLTTTDQVGRFALGLAITAPIILFSQLQLRSIQATDARNEFQFPNYFALRITATVLAMIIIGAITIFGKYPLRTALIIIAVAVLKSIDSIADVFYGVMQKYERMDRIAKSRILKATLSLPAFIAVVFLTENIFMALSAQAAVLFIILITFDLRNTLTTVAEHEKTDKLNFSSIIPDFDFRSLRRLTILALPLGCVMGLLSLKTNIPKYIIEKVIGTDGLGIFAALAYIIVAGNMVIAATGQASLPRLAKYYAAGEKKQYIKLLMQLVGIGAIIATAGSVGALVLGKPVLTILYNREYASYTTLFSLLMFAGGLNYIATFMGHGMTAARYFRAQLPLFIIVTAVTGCAAWNFIPKFGLHGAAFSIAAGAIIQIIGSAFIIITAIRKLPGT